ncbi:hypothetical protein BHM03_00035361 [Ensete ventricosum]|nr:hypothetical protein BHM03_00035361 [Ensete ventricosum]
MAHKSWLTTRNVRSAHRGHDDMNGSRFEATRRTHGDGLLFSLTVGHGERTPKGLTPTSSVQGKKMDVSS